MSTVNLNVELSNKNHLVALAAFCMAVANDETGAKAEPVKKPTPAAVAKMDVVTEETDAPVAKPAQAATKPAAAKPAQAAAKPAAAKPAGRPAAAKPDFSTLDEEAQLEAIKTEVTKHTKKGKSADIKALLAGWGVTRASELTTDQYQGFFDGVVGYGAGETVEALIEQFAGDADLT